MTSKAKEILEQALQLGPTERAAMADELWSSLDEDQLEDLGPEWDQTIARRLHELESGAVQPLTWEESKARILDPSRRRNG